MDVHGEQDEGGDQGHGHDDGPGAGGEHHGMPHEPAPPEAPRRLIPERPLLIRGVALMALAVAALLAAFSSIQKAGWLAALTVAPLLAVTSGLAAWAAVIHLTGGEKFDDHPWV